MFKRFKDPNNPSHQAGYELSDLSAKLLLSLAIAMIVLSLIMQLTLAGSLFYLKRKMTQKQPRSADRLLVAQRGRPPAPRLQRNPPADYRSYHEAQDHFLKSYGWVNQKAGIARIPVDRAMEILSHGK
jgi:hypothetical protein